MAVWPLHQGWIVASVSKAIDRHIDIDADTGHSDAFHEQITLESSKISVNTRRFLRIFILYYLTELLPVLAPAALAFWSWRCRPGASRLVYTANSNFLRGSAAPVPVP